MSDFLQWHPSSYNASSLYNSRKQLIKKLLTDPIKGIYELEHDWRLGQISEIWDDFVFDTVIRQALTINESRPFPESINRYSILDHALFKLYIRREENPTRFRRAFWNLNSYGLRLSGNIYKRISTLYKASGSGNSNSFYKIAFVLKGPYKLAHVEFLHNFLKGSEVFSKTVHISLILIDEDSAKVPILDHIKIISLSHLRNTSDKIKAYIELCSKSCFDHICWVACVQNITLFMGMQLAPVQSYWSMKYHSIIMPTIQKYAGLGFGGESFKYDAISWFRGRAFPDLEIPKVNNDTLKNLKTKFNIPEKSLVIGCFVRAEKLHDEIFYKSVAKIIQQNRSIHFVIASQSMPSTMQEFLTTSLGKDIDRFHHLGWVNTKMWISNLDIYFDSCPRGSCNTVFEAIEASVPFLIVDTAHNRESSALPYLVSAIKTSDIDELKTYGIFSEESERLEKCLELIASKSKRSILAKKQREVYNSLKGKNHLFAKDYLNYFLDLQLTLQDRR